MGRSQTSEAYPKGHQRTWLQAPNKYPADGYSDTRVGERCASLQCYRQRQNRSLSDPGHPALLQNEVWYELRKLHQVRRWFLRTLIEVIIKLTFRALVILPTRELAIQCFQMFDSLNKYAGLTQCLIIGQSAIDRQESDMRKGPDVVIATPGRLIDLLTNSRNLDLDDLEVLIFDEADKLLDMGFKADIERIVELVGKKRQTMLFSATLDSNVKQIIKLALVKPIRIQANPDNRVAEHLRQEVVKLQDSTLREAALLHLVESQYTTRTLIFSKTKKTCHRLAIMLNLLGKKVCELHGDMTQQ